MLERLSKSKAESFVEVFLILFSSWVRESFFAKTFWQGGSLRLWQGSWLFRGIKYGTGKIKTFLFKPAHFFSVTLEHSVAEKKWNQAIDRVKTLCRDSYVVVTIKNLPLYKEHNASFTTLGLYLLVFLLPFLPNLILLLLIGFVGVSFFLRRLRLGFLSLELLSVEPALFIYLLMVTLSTLTSITLVGSMRDWVIYVFAFILFFVFINQIENKEQFHTVILLALVGAFGVSLYAIWQYVVGVPMLSGWVDATQNPYLQTRAFSVFGNPNILAKYLLMLIPFGLALLLIVQNFWSRLFLLVIVLTLGLALLFTFSRGGWLGMLVGLFVFAVLQNKRILIVLLVFSLVLLLVGMTVMPVTVLQRVWTIVTLQDSAIAYRFLVWREAVHIIEDFSLTGVGFGHRAFMEIYPLYMLDRVKAPFHVHNFYLQRLVETGILGFSIFLWLLAGIFKQGLKTLISCQDVFFKHIIIASLASLVAVLVQGLAENILYMPKITILFWLNVSFIFLCRKLSREERRV